ncbi:hypothetical protein GQF00_13245 [Alcanivorax sp. DP30]|nr:hypothetical protein [Alcanivorax sp. DP30]
MAAVFDPDSGGAETFGVCRLGPSEEGPVTHYLANTLIDPDYLPLLADPAMALAALNQLADLRDRDRVTLEDVTAFCNGVEIDPPDDLERVGVGVAPAA